MPVLNAEIAEKFEELADLLEIQGANPFRVRAYRNAARVVATWPKSLTALMKAEGELPKLPGLGEDLTGKVGEIIVTGNLAALDAVKRKVPAGLVKLLKIPGLGPKRVKLIHKKLHVESLKDLERVAKAGEIRELPGLGEKTEARILEELGRGTERAERILLPVADEIARTLLEFLRETSGLQHLIAAGSFRRRMETVGDLDILAACASDSPIMDRFIHCEDAASVLAQGKTKSTILLRSGFQVDLRVVPEESYGAALYYFTGSKAHNIAIRTIGIKHGFKINEYGIFRGRRRVGGATEEEVFKSIDLPYIEPELRENRGEIEAAREGRLPKLVELRDIRGDLHAHTDETDGHLSLEKMATAAREMGYEYLAITDHSRRLSMTKGLDPERLRKQIRRIDQLNGKLRGFRVLKAIEVDILEDGTLDLPDDVLRELDLTVCSIHSKFELPRGKQTERVLRAMDNRYFNVLGHPSGRLIGRRKSLELDMERIIAAARERGCLLEVNAQPDRLDLTDMDCKLAKEMGVKLVISTDAHSDRDLAFMRYGVGQARRGWIEASDVANSRSWPELERILRRG